MRIWLHICTKKKIDVLELIVSGIQDITFGTYPRIVLNEMLGCTLEGSYTAFCESAVGWNCMEHFSTVWGIDRDE